MGAIHNAREFIANVPKIVYQPEFRETQLVRFTRFIEKKYNIELENYWELRDWSFQCYPEFWDSVREFFDIKFSRSHTQVCYNRKNITDAKWFKDALLNYAENILKYKDLHPAIIAVDTQDNEDRVSYLRLYEEVCVFSRALRALGVSKGDVIACYMSNRKEAIFAFLASASIGALWCGVLPQLGPMGVLCKFEQIKPKILFTSETFFLSSEEVSLTSNIQRVVSGLPTLEKVVIVPSKNKPRENCDIEKSLTLSEFVSLAEEGDGKEGMQFEQVPFDHPLVISFTSGTTGAPKGLVHHSGILLASMKDYGLAQDITREDVIFSSTPCGWNTWNLIVNTLHLGAAVVLYEGEVFGASPTRFWDLVDRHRVSSCFVMCIHVEDMALKGHTPTAEHSLQSLKQLLAIGRMISPRCYDFLVEVKDGLMLSPAYGTTESFGLLSGLDHNLPVFRGEIQALSLATDLRVIDEEGNSVLDARGDLVLCNPYPSLPSAILNDADGSALSRKYLTSHLGYWNTGDLASINSITKGFVIHGRSEECIITPGARVCCSEVDFVLIGFQGITDTVIVPHFDSNKNKRIILFVKMESERKLTSDIENEIKKRIENYLSVFHVPHLILQAPLIPYSVTGKKLMRLVMCLINEQSASEENVADPSSLDFYKALNFSARFEIA